MERKNKSADVFEMAKNDVTAAYVTDTAFYDVIQINLIHVH